MIRRTQQDGLFVLPIDLHEGVAELREQGEGRRRAVDVDAPLPRAGEMAADEDLVAVVEPERLAQRVRDGALEQSFDHGLVGVGADEVGAAARAAQQRQRLQEDALAGAGLAADDVEALAEAERHFVDDRDLADAQLAQHDRSAPRRRAGPQRSPQRSLLRRTLK